MVYAWNPSAGQIGTGGSVALAEEVSSRFSDRLCQKNKMEGPVDQGTCPQVWWTELNPQNPHGRRELTLYAYAVARALPYTHA